jgi:hypothetical protein
MIKSNKKLVLVMIDRILNYLIYRIFFKKYYYYEYLNLKIIKKYHCLLKSFNSKDFSENKEGFCWISFELNLWFYTLNELGDISLYYISGYN